MNIREDENYFTLTIEDDNETFENVFLIVPLFEIFGKDFDYSEVNMRSIYLLDGKDNELPMRILQVNQIDDKGVDDLYRGNNEMVLLIPGIVKKRDKVFVVYSSKGREKYEKYPLERLFENKNNILLPYDCSFENGSAFYFWKKINESELSIIRYTDDGFIGKSCLQLFSKGELVRYGGIESKPIFLTRSFRYCLNVWMKTNGITQNENDRNIEIIIGYEYKDNEGIHHQNLIRKYIYKSESWRRVSIDVPSIEEIQLLSNRHSPESKKREYTGKVWLKIFMTEGRKGQVFIDNISLSPKIEYSVSQLEDICHHEKWGENIYEDLLNSLIFYERDYTDKVYPQTIPRKYEIKNLMNGLEIRATPGEFEPISFAIYSLENEKERKVAITISDLVSSNGCTIEKENISVRYARNWIQGSGIYQYGKTMMTPEVLDEIAEGGTEIGPKGSLWCWITAFVPSDMKEGIYNGSISVDAENYTKEIPISICVYPFKLCSLNEGGKNAAVFYKYYYGDRLAQFKDIRRHGFNSITMGGWENRWPNISTIVSVEDVEAKVDFCHMDSFMSDYRKAEFSSILIYSLSGLQRHFTRNFESILPGIFSAWGNRIPAGGFFPDSILPEHENGYENFKASFKEIIRNIQAHGKANNWPLIYFFSIDEPFSHSYRMGCSNEYLKLIKQAEKGIKTFLTCEKRGKTGEQFWGEMIRNVDICCMHTNSINEETIAEAEKNNKVLWFYGPGYFEDPELYRFLSGYYFWKTGAQGFIYWKYLQPSGNPFDEQDSQYKDACFVYPREWKMDGKMLYPTAPFNDSNESIPTIQWEGAREGIDDLRYLLTLKLLTEKSGKRRHETEELFEYINYVVLLKGSPYNNPSLFGRDFGYCRFYQDTRDKVADLIMDLLEDGE